MRIRYSTAAFAAAALWAATAAAHGYTIGGLKIGHPWSFPAAAGAPTAAGFMTITNTGSRPDRLLGLTTPEAERVEIHQSSMAPNGVMSMRQIDGGVPIAPGQTVVFGPGGYHLMMIHPRRALAVGDRVKGVLRFEHAGAAAVDFHVQVAPPAGAQPGAGPH